MLYSDAMLPLSLLDLLYSAYYTQHIHSVKKEGYILENEWENLL